MFSVSGFVSKTMLGGSGKPIENNMYNMYNMRFPPLEGAHGGMISILDF